MEPIWLTVPKVSSMIGYAMSDNDDEVKRVVEQNLDNVPEQVFTHYVAEGNVEMIKFLINHMVLEDMEDYGELALISAIGYKHQEIANLLIEFGIPITKDVLLVAMFSKQESTMRWIVEICPNDINCLKIAKIILDRGNYQLDETDYCINAMLMAIVHCRLDLVKILAEHVHIGPEVLETVVNESSLEIFQFFVEMGIHVSPYIISLTAIDNLPFFKYLIDTGVEIADLQLSILLRCGMEPLKYLVDSGVDMKELQSIIENISLSSSFEINPNIKQYLIGIGFKLDANANSYERSCGLYSHILEYKRANQSIIGNLKDLHQRIWQARDGFHQQLKNAPGDVVLITI